MTIRYLDRLIDAIKIAGHEIFWQGGASHDQVLRLESLLQTHLPPSFKYFLEQYGGGGVINAEISGIEDNDAEIDNGGTVFGDTEFCRRNYALPQELVVIYFHDEETCWCLDTSSNKNDECAIVSYNVFKKSIDKTISTNFKSFIEKHLTLYAKA